MKTKKKKNIIAIGGCFITTLLLQIYSIELVHVSIMFPIGLGIIALIIGYFFMDAIRKYIEQDRIDDKFYLDHAISHESELWLERYTELLNTQKATYTATKKNAEYQMKQFEGVISRLETLEKNQATTLQKVLELQKKALEGQKKALNIEINHSKENANKIMEILQEEPKQEVSGTQFDKLLSLEESNQKLFQDQLNRLVEIKDHLETVEKVISQAPTPQKVFIDDYYQEEPLSASDDEFVTSMEEEESLDNKYTEIPFEEEIKENASEADRIDEEPELEADIPSDEIVTESKVVPLYDDPNKALTADEIAKLFASFGQ